MCRVKSIRQRRLVRGITGEVDTQVASNSLVIAGRGWMRSGPGREKANETREDVLSVLPFSLAIVHLHGAGKAAYLGQDVPTPPCKVRSPWNPILNTPAMPRASRS